MEKKIIDKLEQLGYKPDKLKLFVTSDNNKWEGYWNVVVYNEDKPIYFVKISKKSEGSEYITKEAKTLQYINKIGIRNVPRLIYSDYKTLLVQEFVEGTPNIYNIVKDKKKIFRKLFSWLISFHNKTEKKNKYGLIHGDLKNHNFVISEDTIKVIDWVYSKETYQFIDVIVFIDMYLNDSLYNNEDIIILTELVEKYIKRRNMNKRDIKIALKALEKDKTLPNKVSRRGIELFEKFTRD